MPYPLPTRLMEKMLKASSGILLRRNVIFIRNVAEDDFDLANPICNEVRGDLIFVGVVVVGWGEGFSLRAVDTYWLQCFRVEVTMGFGHMKRESHLVLTAFATIWYLTHSWHHFSIWMRV